MKFLLTGIIAVFFSMGLQAKSIVIFSSRKPQLINPLLKQYTEKTGVKFELRTGKDGALIQQLKIEGEKAKADVLMTVDAGNLWYAKTQNLFSPLGAKNFNHISQHLKDSENHWVGLSIRARTIVYHSDRVKSEEIKKYEDLALPTWKDRLCLRTSKKVYNQSLVGMLIHELGEERAKAVVKGWVNNTVKIFSSDTKLLKAIEAGQCDVGIVNTYYLGRIQRDNPESKLRILWPNQKSYGVHVNVSGAGVLKHSKNKSEAEKFLVWLSKKEAQATFAQLNLEFPVVENVKLDPITKKWGEFKQNTTFHLNKAGEFQKNAIKLMQEVNYR